MQELTQTNVAPLKSNGVKAHVSGSVTSRPILFSTEMVKAILSGQKTQTRRIVKEPFQSWMKTTNPKCEWWDRIEEQCNYGQVGNLLWVRETWQQECIERENELGKGWRATGNYLYKADGCSLPKTSFSFGKWKPSIFMPREACRIELRITDIKVERLQNISEEDARREGVKYDLSLEFNQYLNYEKGIYQCQTAVESFRSLWSEINGQKSWEENPFVWVITFERTEMPSKHYR